MATEKWSLTLPTALGLASPPSCPHFVPVYLMTSPHLNQHPQGDLHTCLHPHARPRPRGDQSGEPQVHPLGWTGSDAAAVGGFIIPINSTWGEPGPIAPPAPALGKRPVLRVQPVQR